MVSISFLLLALAGAVYMHQDLKQWGRVRALSAFGFAVGVFGLLFQVLTG